ncbi:uncharacterized protein BDZ83DRAFT_652960 [Colletotrichum acutatum]|uniref:Uncharacterized protein n=1 Tax=Glomerella acutata TaxID=27357 RepID=A0AAD8UKW0_GLOAC|nr:uncharacterized protein BDZ83DRAFT_652960 [Colletotrichum acutatum]KAK1723589.1 hypothetical protein BDZ83DRAFT_652960 [Colletotrichum acutatum]
MQREPVLWTKVGYWASCRAAVCWVCADGLSHFQVRLPWAGRGNGADAVEVFARTTWLSELKVDGATGESSGSRRRGRRLSFTTVADILNLGTVPSSPYLTLVPITFPTARKHMSEYTEEAFYPTESIPVTSQQAPPWGSGQNWLGGRVVQVHEQPNR